MKKMKKIGALALAIMMITLTGAAYAAGNADGQLTNGKDGMLFDDENEGAIDINTLTFPKEIVLYNTTSAEVHYPVITYNYSISSVSTTGKTVTDGDVDVGDVYPGAGAGTEVTISSSVSFTNADSKTEVTPNGKIASKDIVVTVNPSAFTHAGIYRYLITESDGTADANARTAAGISRGANYSNTRYLDIYVRRTVAADTDVTTDYVVYGYVLFKGSDSSITNAESEVTKSQGFVATETSSGVYGTTDVDYYETYNLKVTKLINGTLAETGHQFPFSVAFNSPVTTDAVIEWAKGTAATGEATITGSALTLGDATTAGYSSSAIKLSNGEYVKFYGIPAGTTTAVSEINDTYDIYTASQDSIEGGTSTAPNATNLVANHVAASIYTITAVANATTVTSNSEKDTELKVKNVIAVVSPTGYVSRFAPYALMLAAGIALVVILVAKRRRHTDED